MDSARTKSARPVAIADHLWELFEEMAHSMGSDRDALINQAMYLFARVNGFLEPSRAAAAVGVKTNPAGNRPASMNAPEFETEAVAAEPFSPSSASEMELSFSETDAAPALSDHDAPSAPEAGWPEYQANPSASAPTTDDDFGHRKVAERVLQTAAELERMIKSRSEPRVLPPETDRDSSAENGAVLHAEEGTGLFVVGEDGHEGRVAKDRFLIGRGKHCDFVISSGKVSREHAVIVREGADYFIEDLGSSNGTWFNKQRVKRRKIVDGDEYFICSDKIRLVLR